MNISNIFLFKRSNGIWYIIYKDLGRIRWKSTKAKHKNEALVFLTDFKENAKPKPKEMLLSEFVKEFETLEGPNLRESTLAGFYRRAFDSFSTLCGDRNLATYTPRDVDLFKAKCLKSSSPTTVNIQFRTLKAAFNCAVRWDIIKENPFNRCSPLRIPEKRPTFVTEDEFHKLCEATSDPLFKRLFEFAVLTGLRQGEILNLQWEQVDLDKKLILVNNSEHFLTKTGKTRAVPMSEIVFGLLSEISYKKNHSPYVFQYRSKPLSKSYVIHKFRESRKAADIKDDISFHSLRHTFATWLVKKGVSIYEVQKLLGHSDVKVTQVYSHLAASELHDAVNKISI